MSGLVSTEISEFQSNYHMDHDITVVTLSCSRNVKSEAQIPKRHVAHQTNHNFT